MAEEQMPTGQPAGPDATEIATYIAGAVLLLASFLPMLEIDFGVAEDDGAGFGAVFGAFIDTEWSAWSNAFSIFPLVTLPILGVLVLVGARALGRFTTTSVPDRLAGFPLSAARAALAGFGLVAVLAQVVRALLDTGSDEEGSFAIGIGGWLSALALAALVFTSVREADASAAIEVDRRRPDQRAAAVIAGGTLVMVVASFLDVWSVDGEDGVTAWSEGGRPVYLVPLAMAVLAAVAAAVDLRSDRRRALLGVDLGRWRVVLGALALFAALALLIGNPAFGSFGSFIDTGAGVYLSILGAAAVLAGALLKPGQAIVPGRPDPEPPVPPPSPPSPPTDLPRA